MNYRKLGNTDVKVSEISLGCWTMGGLNFVNGIPNGWANVNEDEVVAAIKLAIDRGVRHSVACEKDGAFLLTIAWPLGVDAGSAGEA